MYSNMIKKFAGSAMSPLQGAQKLMSGDVRGGLGDIAFGPDAYYGNYWRKQTGLRSPQPEMEFPGIGGEQVGYGDYTGGLGVSGGQNPYAMIRGR